MHLLGWIDNRTLVACQCIIAAVFSLVLFCMWRIYPQLRGVGSMALGFLLGIPAAALYASRGNIPTFLTTVVANLLIFTVYFFLYRGVLQFCQARGHMPIYVFGATAALIVLVYFSRVHDNIVPRIFVILLTIGLGRTLMAYEIYRHANRRMHMILFSASLGVFGLTSIVKAIITPFAGGPTNYFQSDSVQSSQLLFGVLFICVDGMFYLTMLIREITQTIEHQAQLDFLTGTLNRRGIEESLLVEIARTRRSSRPIAVLLIDIDHFKVINDAHGHAAGDEALRLVAHAIDSVLRVYDTLGRFGGDEFLLILPETSGEPAMHIAGRIREALTTLSASSRTPAVTLSIGVTHFERDEDPMDIVARADVALYEAKRAGRNCARLQPPVPPSEVTLPPTPRTSRSLLSRVSPLRRIRKPLP